MLVREVIEILTLKYIGMRAVISQVCRRIILRPVIVVYHPSGRLADEIVFSMVIIAVAHVHKITRSSCCFFF